MRTLTLAGLLAVLLATAAAPAAALSTPAAPVAARSTAAKRAFMRAHACPSVQPHTRYTCPGFVVDHVIALACGGRDHPSNMQYQTIAAGKAKDRIERKGCPAKPAVRR